MLKVTLFFFPIFILSFSLIASVSRANFVGNDTNNFNPTPDGLDFITVHSSETLGFGILNSNLFFTYAADSLPEAFDKNGRPIKPSDQISFADVSFSYGVAEKLEAGLTFSTLLDQKTDRSNERSQFNAMGLNEIRLLSKYKFIQRDPFGLAAILSANFNQSQNSPFAGMNSRPTLNAEGVIDQHFGQILVAFNFGYRFRQNGSEIPDSVYGPLPDQYIASLATSYYFTSADLKIIAEVYAARAAKSTRNVAVDRISSEWILGGKYDATSNISVQGGGGARIGEGLFTPEWRAFLGLNVNFDVLKKPAVDSVSADVEAAEILRLAQTEVDPNEDLVKETFDELTQQHEFYLRTSIPDVENFDRKTPFEVIRLQNFDFDFGSAEIRPDLYETLDRLAKYLSSPDIVKIRIEGHTDSLGVNERNRIVSQARADKVKEYLHSSSALTNLDMEAVGYGADRAVADNGNFQGRKKNRRVEIRIVRRPSI